MICFYLPFQHVYSEGGVFISRLTRLVCVTQICIMHNNTSLTIYPDIDECLLFSPCHINATCTNTVGSFYCTCNQGLAGDGYTCQGKPDMFEKKQ